MFFGDPCFPEVVQVSHESVLQLLDLFVVEVQGVTFVLVRKSGRLDLVSGFPISGEAIIQIFGFRTPRPNFGWDYEFSAEKMDFRA